NHANRTLRRHYAAQPQAGRGEELGEFVFGALLAAHCQHQHLDIEMLGGRRSRLVTHYHLANEHAAVRGQLIAHKLENRPAMLIAPIVDDVLHDVGVAAIRDPLEEAAALDGDAPFASGELVLRHAGNDLCAIEQYTLHSWIALQDQ